MGAHVNIGIALIAAGLVQVFFGFAFFRKPETPITLLRTPRSANKDLTLPGRLLFVGGLLFAVAGASLDIIAGFR